MNDLVVWIKMVIKLCMCEFETEEEKKANFEKMEEVYNQFSDAEKKNIRNIMTSQLEVNDRIYTFSVLVYYMENEDFQKEFMESILEGDFDCYTGSMLEWVSLVHVKGEYRRKRILYRRNMEGFDKMLGINYPYLPVKGRNRKRIVIVAGQLLNDLHAPTRVMMNIAYVLQECFGYEVLLFICPSNAMLPSDLCLQKSRENIYKEFDEMPIQITYREAEFMGYQISMTPWSHKEYSMMLWMIYTWNPIFVLDMNTLNAVVGLIGKFTTVVSLPMSTACPISEGEILVRNGRQDESTEEEYLAMMGEHQVQLAMKVNFPVLAEASQNNFTREALGLPTDQFLVAVVGNRLEKEINKELIQVMKKILEETQNISFVMIGSYKEIKGYFIDEVFDGHVYELGYCFDLIGVYKTLNLFLNPQRSGGGFSGGMALLAGIPVVTLPECDVAYNCGEEWVVHDFAEMAEVVTRYANDAEFYNQKVLDAQRYGETSVEERLVHYVEKLLEGIYGILEERE